MRRIETMATIGAKGNSRLSCRGIWRWVQLALAGALLGMAAGCNSTISSTGNSVSTQYPPGLYLAGAVGQLQTAGYQTLQTFAIDHTANTFAVSYYGPAGSTIQDSGSLSALSNGIVDLDVTYYPGGEITKPPMTGNWAVELPGEAALVELEETSQAGTTTSFAPLVPTDSCPNLATAETFQFVTIPEQLNLTSTIIGNHWNPRQETAYGSVSIATKGTAVTFSNVSQHTLPSANGGTAGKPIYPAPSSATSACSPTFYGQVISVPTSLTVTGSPTAPASATIGIGPTGFLVEDAGSGAPDPDTNLGYENILGAGFGAIGVPQPSSALSASTLASAHYQGILYGSYGSTNGVSEGLTGGGFRLIGSFGYSDLHTSCPELPAPNTGKVLYGGEFTNNDPSSHAFGNCDLAIDLGSPGSGNGLFPAATVYVTTAFPGNGIAKAYSFPAVAIAGQISGKYAIFLIAADTIGTPQQAWGIYLLQAN